jgi:hypothetical protein
LFVATLTVVYCLVQGFFEGGDRASGDCRVAGTTPGRLLTRVHGMVEAERALGRARMECDAILD